MTPREQRLMRVLRVVSFKRYKSVDQITDIVFKDDFDPVLKRVRTFRTGEHLDKLKRMGLVDCRVIGKRKLYRRKKIWED